MSTGVRALVERLEDDARAALDPDVYDYVAGGAGREVSLAEAERAWRALRFAPHVLVDAPPVDVSIKLAGRRYFSPIGVAPVGYGRLLHPDAEVGTARGATAYLNVVSARSDRSPADIGAAADGWWSQVYVTSDRRYWLDRAVEAAQAGADALVLTGDTPLVAPKARAGRPRDLAPGREQVPATTDDIGVLHEATGLPVLVKGVLRADDTHRVLDAGAAGVIVSNHGGRQLDQAMTAAQALPSVAQAAAGAPVLVDGGVRTGHDVLAALALGADAVLVGRPVAWALAAAGADGVRSLLDAWTAEFAAVLALAGLRSCAEIGPDLLA